MDYDTGEFPPNSSPAGKLQQFTRASLMQSSTERRPTRISTANLMARWILLLLSSCPLNCCTLASRATSAEQPAVAVLVYGGTPSGIAAAVAAASAGQRVVLIEPTARVGGLVTSGLSHTDFHSRESLSGAFADFAKRVYEHYVREYGEGAQQVADTFGGTFAEPKVNLLVFEQLLAEHPQLQVYRGQRLLRAAVQHNHSGPAAPTTATSAIESITCIDTSGAEHSYSARVFIDATYEGDLMALSGVEWRVGREGADEYGESLAPATADQQLQAYNFRFIMTREPALRVAPQAPAGYRREDFVGVLDALASGSIKKIFDYPSACIFKAHMPPLPNGKYDINDVSRNLVRLSLPGVNAGWPDGSHSQRQQIFAEHLRDQVGLLYFLQNDPAVPSEFQAEAREWGWCRDEFEESGHLPPQLYVREARRMLGAHVYVQRDSEHAPGDARAVLHVDSIAMADYGNNCHGTAHEGPRFGGKHTGEFYNPVPPYQIPYGVLVPRSHRNLLVSCAVSSSHVGFCALRLEPVWMSLGQAAGEAAALAVEQAGQSNNSYVSVQDVPIRSLQTRLHQAGSATIYVTDVPLTSPDFAAVQWWGTQGGYHGLWPTPARLGQRGKKILSQYCEAIPYHAAELERNLEPQLTERWRTVASVIGIPQAQQSAFDQATTRGDFIRTAYALAQELGLTTGNGAIPRCHPRALLNIHAPGEVDNRELAGQVVWDQRRLPGIVVDDEQATLVGTWQYSTHTPPYVGRGYLHDLKEGQGEKSVTFTPDLPHSGQYEVRLSHCYNIRRATNALVRVKHARGIAEFRIDQQQTPEHAQLFRSLGVFDFEAGQQGWVQISNAGTEGKYVIADAVQFLPRSGR